VLKFKHVDSLKARSIKQQDDRSDWVVFIMLSTPRRNGSKELTNSNDESQPQELHDQIEQEAPLPSSANFSPPKDHVERRSQIKGSTVELSELHMAIVN
jgi:hypothetical protein